MNKSKKIYFSLILSCALAFMIEYVLGYTNAIEIPKNIFGFLGVNFGNLVVGLLTISLPYFLLAILTMPALVFFTGRMAPRYSLINQGNQGGQKNLKFLALSNVEISLFTMQTINSLCRFLFLNFRR